MVLSGHEGPLKSARILTNDEARYGTLSEDATPKEGDTTNADALMTHKGHPLDLLRTPTTGKMMLDKEKSAWAVKERAEEGTKVAKFRMPSGDTVDVANCYVKENGHSTAADTGGYGAGSEPYEDFPASHAMLKGIETSTAFGTAPMTELTANVGIVETH